MKWHACFERPMPWKGEKNPYFIWLSEIILQQTRVEQGLPYFEKFKTAYPTVKDLANAAEDEVMKLWEGLGYYSRARNMLATAKIIAEHYGGAFPDTYEGLLSLKGVGPYTAAAIASFAYNLPCAVLDGNVFRVLSRYWGIELPIDSTEGRKLFASKAQMMLDTSSPGLYNQAMMDLGACICTPRNPLCNKCPVQPECTAYAKNTTQQLPVKGKRLVRKDRFFNYCVVHNERGNIWIRKRTGQDIWQQLYEFPLIESDFLIDNALDLEQSEIFRVLLKEQTYEIVRMAGPFKQELTHQRIIATFWELKIKEEGLAPNVEGGIQVDRKKLNRFAFPKVIDCYLNDNSLYLNLV